MKALTFLSIFLTIFLAELGDKTQLATMLFASEGKHNPWLVFLAASLALMASSAAAVLAGNLLGQAVNPRLLRLAAGTGFILIGIWTIWKG